MRSHLRHERVQDTIELLYFDLLEGFGVRNHSFFEVHSEQVILKLASLQLRVRMDAPHRANSMRTDTVDENLWPELREARAEQHLRNPVRQIIEPRFLITTCVVVARGPWYRFQIRVERDTSLFLE